EAVHHSSGGDAPSSAVKLHFLSGVRRYNTPNLNMKKSPSGQAAEVNAAPGQEGLFDHMFDHRQRRSTRKQWNKEWQRVSEM
ncbi:hypothetical protein AAAT94_01165, partial [Intestinimonas aquisgranensis]|nr:hypothetical protein [Intestinimonas aquisgranensis]